LLGSIRPSFTRRAISSVVVKVISFNSFRHSLCCALLEK
jgi:hypothetical protein